jgi:hypothetical protein
MRSPLTRAAFSASSEPVSGKEDNLEVGLSRSTLGTGAFNVHIYLHAELQVKRSNKTAALSGFTNYDDACDHCSRTPPANFLWDIYTTRAQVVAREQTLPRPKSTSPSGQTPLRPSPALVTCSPRISQEATLSTVACTSTNLGASSITTSDELLSCPSLASVSTPATERRSTSSYIAELTY